MNLEEQYKLKIIKIIQALLPEVQIYLFGSRARGSHQPRSDIDIALDAGEPIDRLRLAEIRTVLEGTTIPYKIDVVDIHTVSDSMRQMIDQEKIGWK
ncbi:MAG: nucleotidyltransferase domain-containing protein [Candidatus Babeliales bacterium]